MAKTIQAVIIGYYPSWRKWPDTADKDYNDVLSKRQAVTYKVGGEDVVINFRWYPVHRAYVRAGVNETPVTHPYINNTCVPPQLVLDAMLQDFRDLARDGVQLVLWEHAYQCYPGVAQHLKSIFAHSILIHGDDAPGSTEIKTSMIARYFDSAFHGNVIWTHRGDLTRNLYLSLGVDDVHYISMTSTGGFIEGVAEQLKLADEGAGIASLRRSGDSGDDIISRRLKQMKAKAYSNDLVFVGGNLGPHRAVLNSPNCTALFNKAGLRTKMMGTGMRDGELHPRNPANIGEPVAQVYLDAFAVLNLQFIGLLGTRPFDVWDSGSLLVQWDPVGEMASVGIHAGVHYASYDGLIVNLIERVLYYQDHLDEVEAILRAGYALGKTFPREHSVQGCTERVLNEFTSKFKWGEV